MTPTAVPLALDLGPSEILLILVVVILLFGAKKLPELARGSGRALRIFKAETKGLLDDEDETKSPEQRQIDAQQQPRPAEPMQTPESTPAPQPMPAPQQQPGHPDSDR